MLPWQMTAFTAPGGPPTLFRTFAKASSQYLSRTTGISFPLTITAWIRNTSYTSGGGSIASFVDASTDEYHWFNQSSTGQARMETDGVTATTIVVPLSTWTHVAGVVSAANARAVYVDGANKATNTTSRTPTAIDSLQIGGYVSNSTPSGTAFFDGNIGEVAVWSTALTDGEIEAVYNGASPLAVQAGSLWAFWPLHGVASPEPDVSGNGRNLTLNNF